PVDLHHPGADAQLLRRLGDVLAGAEFVEIVVVGVDLFGRDRAVADPVFLDALEGIEILGRIGNLGDALRRCEAGKKRRGSKSRARCQECTTVQEHALRRRLMLGDFPSPAMDDIHVRQALWWFSPTAEVRAPRITGKSRLCDAGVFPPTEPALA